MFMGEFGMPPASEAAARAGHEITRGRFARAFWFGSVVTGHLLPLALLGLAWSPGGFLAGLAALTGLYLYEVAFVTAPQEVPNS
jgi:hypothetical protein